MKRPARGYESGRSLLLALSYAALLIRSPRRLSNAFRKGTSLLRTVGPAGVWHTLLAKFHWGSTPYAAWVKIFDTLRPQDVESIQQRIKALPGRPLISLILVVHREPVSRVTGTIESVLRQLYPEWELCIADDGSSGPEVGATLAGYAARDHRVRIVTVAPTTTLAGASNAALQLARGEYVVPFDVRGELPRHGLYVVAEELTARPDTDVLYSDEDNIDAAGRRFDPYFKPDWNPDLLTSQDYVSRLIAIRAGIARSTGGFRDDFEGAEEYDFRLRCIANARPEHIRHSPYVLYHRRSEERDERGGAEATLRALQEFVARSEPVAKVEPGPIDGTFRIRRPLPSNAPPVTIIVPTRDRSDLLRQCIESIEQKTTYPSYEIMVVDNQSQAGETFRYFDELRASGKARILAYDRPFNYAAINNLAVGQARGELVCLLNNDVEVISPDWLSEMVGHALRPQVGAVGAKLYYPDGSLQHAGVIVGLGGVADHSHRYLPGNAPGYFSRVQLVQNLSAVTAACLVIRRELYLRMGGMDADNLPVAFNDVDLCLRLRDAGYLNVWTPFAELIHHESVSRGTEDSPEKRARSAREIEFMKSRWGSRLLEDPCYSPNLTLNSENFALAWPPRTAKPWHRQSEPASR